MKTRVLIQGYYGAGNLGDDALMVAALALLRRFYPSRAIAIRARPAPYLQRLASGIRVLEPEKQLASVDLQVYGGGTQYFTFPLTMQRGSPVVQPHPKEPTPFGLHFLRHKKAQPEPHIGRWAALGIGVGPFDRAEDEDGPRQLFQRLGYVAVRDIASLETCRRWGLGHAVLRSDLSFLPGPWEASDQASRARPQPPFRVAVIPRDWPHSVEGAAYHEPLWQVVANLRSQGLQVTFVLFQKGEVWESELVCRGEMFDVWNPDCDTLPQFLNRLAQFDCLLTARYHGAIFGALLGKPVICIEIEPKLGLAAELLMGKYLWRPPFRMEACLALIRKLFREYEAAQRQLAQSVAVQQQLAAQMANEFQAWVASA